MYMSLSAKRNVMPIKVIQLASTANNKQASVVNLAVDNERTQDFYSLAPHQVS